MADLDDEEELADRYELMERLLEAIVWAAWCGLLAVYSWLIHDQEDGR